MIARFGFDERAALAMRSACGMDEDDTFIDRARATEFWGLYDPEPVGAVIVHAPWIHVGCLKAGRSAFAIRRVVTEALKKHGQLLAPIKQPNERANHLAAGLGFIQLMHKNGWTVFGRSAWAS